MTIRTITLPAINKTVPLSAYIEAVKTAKANPDRMFKHGLTTWWATSGAEIMQQFRAGMMDRINQRIPYSQRGLTPGAMNTRTPTAENRRGKLFKTMSPARAKFTKRAAARSWT